MLFSDQDRTRDHESDPAHTPGDGWVGEGGASHLGPATHLDSAHVAAESASDAVAEDAEGDGEPEEGA